MSEQANNGCAAGFGVRLIGCTDNAVLPIGMHDYAEAFGCCALVDKTMFIADVLDCDASVMACCRPEGFGKSMNLSMLKAFLERPVVGRAGRSLFAGAQIWDTDGGHYRDEYACYPVISQELFWRCEAWHRCCRRRARCSFGRVHSPVGALGGSGFSTG